MRHMILEYVVIILCALAFFSCYQITYILPSFILASQTRNGYLECVIAFLWHSDELFTK